MNNTVYVVTMYRRSTESHSYVVGVYTTIEAARAAGTLEEIYRGGKYQHEIVSGVLDEMPKKPQVEE